MLFNQPTNNTVKILLFRKMFFNIFSNTSNGLKMSSLIVKPDGYLNTCMYVEIQTFQIVKWQKIF